MRISATDYATHACMELAWRSGQPGQFGRYDVAKHLDWMEVAKVDMSDFDAGMAALEALLTTARDKAYEEAAAKHPPPPARDTTTDTPMQDFDLDKPAGIDQPGLAPGGEGS